MTKRGVCQEVMSNPMNHPKKPLFERHVKRMDSALNRLLSLGSIFVMNIYFA